MRSRLRARRSARVLALVIAAICVACQPAQNVTITAPAASPVRPTRNPARTVHPTIPAESLKGIGIQVWHPWLGAEAGLLESQVAEFNKENTWGITVRATGMTSFTELYDRVSASEPGESAPQLVIALPEHALAWDTAGDVVDLTNYISDSTYGLTSEEVGDFPTAFWSQDGIGGRQLGVPAQRSAKFLIYDQTWARELGFGSAPKTEKEFRDQACAAHASLGRDDDPGNDGRGGWQIDADSMTFLSWLTAFGGGVLDGKGYRFLSPKNLEAATFVKQLYDDGCSWLPPSGADRAAAFAARTALFDTAGLEDLPDFTRAMAAAGNADDWTVMTFPGASQTGLVTYGSSFVVLKSTPEQQLAAWLFARWMLSADNQKRWVETTGLFPLRRSEVGLLSSYARSHPQWAAAIEYLPEAQIQPQLSTWRQVRVMLGDGFDAMFRSNTPAGRVAEILAIMDRTASEIAQ
jgi:ABC-type glycerol-3-phosphate transport system substrate-binding protein